LKILIDLQSCQSGSRLGGIGRYSLNLTKSILSNYNFDCYILLSSALPAENVVRSQLSGYLPQHKIISMSIPEGVAECHGNITFTKSAEFMREYFISLLNPDVLLITSLMEGFGDDVVISVAGLFDSNRTSVILYDLIPFVEAERYLTNKAVETHCYRKLEFMKNAGMLLSISEFSKNEAVEFANIDSAKINNISSAVDEKFRPNKLSEKEKIELYNKFNIKKDYLLFTGSFDIRKNQARLIQSFSLLPNFIKEKYQLVIVGNGNSEIYRYYKNIAYANGLNDSDVLLLGHVDDKDLLALYNSCTLFVFPSLREGFGLPLLEAMSCAVPAIGSSTTSIPEVLGPNGITFDPANIESITSCILALLTDHDARTTLAISGYAHSKNFSWSLSALKAIEFLNKQFNNTSPQLNLTSIDFYDRFINCVREIGGSRMSDQSAKLIAKSTSYNEMLAKSINGGTSKYRVACVSTWGIKCGIASYAKQLLEKMNCEYSVYAAYPNSPLVYDDAENIVRSWNQGFDSLDNLESQLEMANAEIIIFQVNYGLFDFISLNRVILKMKALARSIIIILHSTTDPPKEKLDRNLRQLQQSLDISDLVFVHSLADVDNVKNVSEANVKFLPQGLGIDYKYSINSKSFNSAVPFRVATFGFFLPHKGLLEIIEAVSILRNRGIKIHLNMLNAEYPNDESKNIIQLAKKLINSFGLNQCITINTAYLSDSEVIEKLTSCELIVFPYQHTNESSSAAVRMALSSGKPVAVTPVPIFSEVSDIAYVFSGEGAAQIADGIQEVIKMYARGEIESLVKAAANWVQCHRFSEVAKYVDLLLTMNQHLKVGI